MKFRRQSPLGRYIVDFVSYDAQIVVELDGGHHAEPDQAEHDAIRDRWLRSEGFAVLRYWDSDVLETPEAVLAAILDAVERRRS